MERGAEVGPLLLASLNIAKKKEAHSLVLGNMALFPLM